jgi:hypothetical protein
VYVLRMGNIGVKNMRYAWAGACDISPHLVALDTEIIHLGALDT